MLKYEDNKMPSMDEIFGTVDNFGFSPTYETERPSLKKCSGRPPKACPCGGRCK